MTWSFRLRFNLGNTSGLLYPGKEWTLESEPPIYVRFLAVDTEEIRMARRIALWGSGYASEEAAGAAGITWRARLIRAFSCLRIGADFGDRAPKGAFTEHGLQVMAPGRRAFNNVHGLMVFQTEPPPVFLAMDTPAAWQSPPNDRVEAAIVAARDRPQDTESIQIAFDIFSASFSQTSADARFVLLMVALESLIEPRPRSAEVRQILEALIVRVRESELPKTEIESVVGSLRALTQESIGQAGRRLARTLDPRTYMSLSAVAFFTRCYALRSRLVHGQHPVPPRQEIDEHAAQLEVFVADLLCME